MCKSKTHPCGRACSARGITRLRLVREMPEGEYAEEASSSANTRTATRKAITRDNSSNLISLLSRQLTSSHASDLFAAGIARGTMRKVVSTRHPFYSSPRACI